VAEIGLQHPRHRVYDQNLLVIGPVENPDVSAARQASGGVPEKIMRQLLLARLLETMNLAPLRIDSAHYVPDGAIFAGAIHPLKNQEQPVLALGIQDSLDVAEFTRELRHHRR
jgi:hypothetical protein